MYTCNNTRKAYLELVKPRELRLNLILDQLVNFEIAHGHAGSLRAIRLTLSL